MADAHKKPGPKKPSLGMVIGAMVILIGLCVAVPRISAWWEERDVSEAREERADNKSRAQNTSWVRSRDTVEPYVRKPLEAPARTSDWSRVVNVPSGYRPLFCEADESLACTSTETDMTLVRYVFDCRDLRGNASIREQEADLVACRVRAKGDEALNLAVWLEPY